MHINLPEKRYYSIGEIAKALNVNTSLLRFWEKEFKEIKPKMINKRRYYSSKQIKIIKMIKFLLKNKGMTIKGVKNLLASSINKLDGNNFYSLKAEHYSNNLKTKSKIILEKINKIKFNGKKNTS